eukprot:154532-Amphidinium_carterae.1
MINVEAPVVAAAPGIGAQAQQRESDTVKCDSRATTKPVLSLMQAPPATYKHHFPTRAGEPPAMVGAG